MLQFGIEITKRETDIIVSSIVSNYTDEEQKHILNHIKDTSISIKRIRFRIKKKLNK